MSVIWEWLDPHKKDFWDVVAHIAAVVGGLLAAFKGIDELRENRRLRQRELAWAQAEALRDLIDRIYADPKSRDALLMLDYSKRDYEVRLGKTVPIVKDDVDASLRTRNLEFPLAQAYARDCFDTLFRRLEDIEVALRIDLVRQDHVLQALDYFVRLMARRRDVIDRFLEEYGYLAVIKLLGRSARWPKNGERASPDAERDGKPPPGSGGREGG